jgi:IS30 family transposase
MRKSPKKKRKKRIFERISFKERVIIENRYCIDKKKVTDIALELNRPKSAVSREIGGRPRISRGKYRADTRQAEVEASRGNQGRKSKLDHKPLSDYVVAKLKLGWSPEQIAIRLPIEYSKDKAMRISYEAIYQHVYGEIYRGGNGKVKPDCEDLRKYLPRRHKRRAKKGFRRAQKLERIESLPSIEERPKEADKRKAIGHWEDDCIVSKQSKERVKSINERVSGVVLLNKMKDGTQEESTRAVCEKVKIIPSPYFKTLTRDRGTENLDYKTIESNTGVKIYFAHPYSSYERGSNENLNGLIRRFFPKKTDFAKVSDEEILKVEYLLNTRPRKRLGGKTPLEVLLKNTGVALEY